MDRGREQACQRALTRKQTLYGRAAHVTVLTAWFLDKSSASSFASAASRNRNEKSRSVCSGWMPQREVICGISETIDRMASTPSPSELLSRLRWGKARCQGALTRERHGAAAHPKLAIFVSLRTAAIAVAPFSPTSLPERLPSEGRGAGMPRGVDTKANARELVREAGGLLE